jgi:hypothetical protein
MVFFKPCKCLRQYITPKISWGTHQLLKYAVVQFHLRLPALEHVVVVVLETLPVSIKLLQAVGVDILDPAICQSWPFV